MTIGTIIIASLCVVCVLSFTLEYYYSNDKKTPWLDREVTLWSKINIITSIVIMLSMIYKLSLLMVWLSDMWNSSL